MYKVIVAHPGKQHSFQMAYAMQKSDLLFQYITTIYDREGSTTRFIKKFLRGNYLKKASTHKDERLNNSLVKQIDEKFALIILLTSKFSFSKKISGFLDLKLKKDFEKKVAYYAIENEVDAVIGYDSNCVYLFDILKKYAPNILRIMDVSIATRKFMKKNYIDDIEKTGCIGLKKEQINLWNDKKLASFQKEIDNTQYFVVPSKMVKNSLIYCGVVPEKIFIVPYGVDINKFAYIQKKERPNNSPLKLLFVGQVTYRKGIHHLLKVVSEFPENKVHLTICGSYSHNSSLYLDYKNKKNIEFKGYVTRDVIASEYRNNDVFVFPTLGEGFGLTNLEAMSSGMPVIVSDLAGGNDAITNYEDGIVFEAGNDSEFHEAIQWFIDHPEKIPVMSQNARKKSIQYTWDNYYKNVSDVVKRCLKNNGKTNN